MQGKKDSSPVLCEDKGEENVKKKKKSSCNVGNSYTNAQEMLCLHCKYSTIASPSFTFSQGHVARQ